MRPGSIALAAGSAIVAIGGLYLLVELRRGAAATVDHAAPAAHGKAARPSPSAPPERATATATPTSGGDKRSAAVLPPSEPMLAKLEARPPEADAVLAAETSDELLEANKLYDRGDYDGARQLALKLLPKTPGNVRLLRVVVSSACILGDGEQANQYATQLPPIDHDQMVERCAKFQIVIK